MKYLLLLFFILILIAVAVFWTQAPLSDAQEVIVYKSPNCGCCVEHSAYMRENGFNVKIEMIEDMSTIKAMYNIPREMQSCHTTVLGNYFVEGHVPMEAITHLMETAPAIDGIALPGMPSGSPGMPGEQLEPFQIYQLTDSVASDFLTL